MEDKFNYSTWIRGLTFKFQKNKLNNKKNVTSLNFHWTLLQAVSYLRSFPVTNIDKRVIALFTATIFSFTIQISNYTFIIQAQSLYQLRKIPRWNLLTAHNVHTEDYKLEQSSSVTKLILGLKLPNGKYFHIDNFLTRKLLVDWCLEVMLSDLNTQRVEVIFALMMMVRRSMERLKLISGFIQDQWQGIMQMNKCQRILYLNWSRISILNMAKPQSGKMNRLDFQLITVSAI
jgi:hypothetical protein